MTHDDLTIALIRDVFYDDNPQQRLRNRLGEAKDRGASLAILPELPLNPWSPATTSQHEDDAEAPNGPRATVQAEAARDIGIGLVGGAIIRDEHSGRRENTALIFDSSGTLLATYSKIHLPEEPGFWETSHYEAGQVAPVPIEGFAMPIGVQICSDINRPQGSQLLAARGAQAILAPRATEQVKYERWRVVFQASALTCCAYIASVDRPRPERGVRLGGQSIAVAPNGKILLETTDPVGIATFSRSDLEQARVDYPGYLSIRSDLYAEAWSSIAPRLEPVRAQ